MSEEMNLERATKILGEAQNILAHQYNLSNGLDKDSIKYHLAIQIILEEIYFNSINKDKLKTKIQELKEFRSNEPHGTVRDTILLDEIKYLEEILEGE